MWFKHYTSLSMTKLAKSRFLLLAQSGVQRTLNVYYMLVYIRIVCTYAYRKLVLRTMPYSSLCHQGRSHTSVCPRCQTFVETSSHVSICPAESAVSQRIEQLHTFLSELECQQTSIYLLTTFKYKLSLVLNLTYQQTFTITIPAPSTQQQTLMKAIRHQNMVGWDNFLWGYTSMYWSECQLLFSGSSSHRRLSTETWDTNLIKAIITLYTFLWKDRN
jgi:hypothetical protein